MRALVTGIAGFIGSHLADRLLKEGWEVYGIDNLSLGKRENVPRGIRWSTQSIESIRVYDIERMVQGSIDVIFHLGALGSVPRSFLDPYHTHKSNTSATLHLLLLAKELQIKRFVFASSSSIYNWSDYRPSPYAVSKKAAEDYLIALQDLCEVFILRYFNVFGPRQRVDKFSGVIPIWIDSLLHNTYVEINGNASIARDFTYVDNVIQATYLAGTMPFTERKARIYDVGCSVPITLGQLLVALRSLLPESKSEIINVAPRVGDRLYSCSDIDLISQALGYYPSVSFAEGLKRTVSWYHDQMIEAAQ